MSAYSLLSSQNWLPNCKPIMRILGNDVSAMIGEICNRNDYHEVRNELVDGWFYATVDSVEYEIGLSRFQQESAIKTLTEIGMIETKQMGLPAKRHFRLASTANDVLSCLLKIDELVRKRMNQNDDQKSKTPYFIRLREISEQDSEFLTTNKTILLKIKYVLDSSKFKVKKKTNISQIENDLSSEKMIPESVSDPTEEEKTPLKDKEKEEETTPPPPTPSPTKPEKYDMRRVATAIDEVHKARATDSGLNYNPIDWGVKSQTKFGQLKKILDCLNSRYKEWQKKTGIEKPVNMDTDTAIHRTKVYADAAFDYFQEIQKQMNNSLVIFGIDFMLGKFDKVIAFKENKAQKVKKEAVQAPKVYNFN